MKKNSKKENWSSDEVGTLIEDFTHQVKLVAEQTSYIPKIQKDIEIIKEDIDVIKMDIDIMKYSLKKKVDIEEFEALEKRVALLESRR